MGGGLMQLVAYGAQDVYLTGNPQITFFKVVYRRHTNFAMESIENFFNGNTNFGKRTTCTISRNGDLITKIYTRIRLPDVTYNGDFPHKGYVQFAWVRRIGHVLLAEMELEIGGSQIDKQYGNWLNIWYELSHKVGHEEGYAKMIGDVPELTSLSSLSWRDNNTLLKNAYTLYVPLQFYFCRNDGLALPLIALQYHEVKINIYFRRLEELFISTDAYKLGMGNLQLEDTTLLVDYVYLDTEERRRFAQVSHEYLIEQLQFTGEESITNNNIKSRLTFNHPSKGLYWFVRLGIYRGGKFLVYTDHHWRSTALEEAAKKICLAEFDLDDLGYFNQVVLAAGEDSYTENNVEYLAVDPADPAEQPKYVFNDDATKNAFDGTRFIGVLSESQPLLQAGKNTDLRDKVDCIIRIFTDNNIDASGYYYPQVEKIVRNDLTLHDLSLPVTSYTSDNRNNFIKSFDVTVWQFTNYGMLIDGSVNPVSEVLLQLNGHDRFSRRHGAYFNLVQPYQCHTNIPPDGLNVYNFAKEPEIHQPTGTCNFSRIDTTQLNLWFLEGKESRFSDLFNAGDNKLYVFTVNYNVLRVMSGMAGLAYSN
jgi:hypothetical protein